MSHQHSLEKKALDTVAEGFRFNALKLPSLPEVTVKVRAVAADPRAGVEDLAAEILRDAGMTARLIRIANSPLLRGRMEVRTLSQAITRLGFHYVRDLVTALALEHAFEPRQPSASQVLRKIWKRSKNVAAISQILARHRTDLASEQALLAGLLHLIGALPLLAAVDEADVGAVDPDELLAMIDSRHAEVGSRILRHWRFPEFIACVPEKYRDAAREDYEEPDFADVVAVASMLSVPLSEQGREAPEWGNFRPAIKLGLTSAKEFYSSDTMQIDLQQSISLLN